MKRRNEKKKGAKGIRRKEARKEGRKSKRKATIK